MMRLLEVDVRQFATAISRPVIGWAIMSLVLVLTKPLVAGALSEQLLILVLAGSISYALATAVFARTIVVTMWRGLRGVGVPGRSSTSTGRDVPSRSSWTRRCPYTLRTRDGLDDLSLARRHRLFIILMTALLAGVAFFVSSSQTKLYTASALVRVQQKVTNANDVFGSLQTGERLAQTYAEIATTDSVAREIRRELPPSVPDDAIKVDASQVSSLELMKLAVIMLGSCDRCTRRKCSADGSDTRASQQRCIAGYARDGRPGHRADEPIVAEREADGDHRNHHRPDLEQRPRVAHRCLLGPARRSGGARALGRAPGDCDDPDAEVRPGAADDPRRRGDRERGALARRTAGGPNQSMAERRVARLGSSILAPLLPRHSSRCAWRFSCGRIRPPLGCSCHERRARRRKVDDRFQLRARFGPRSHECAADRRRPAPTRAA